MDKSCNVICNIGTDRRDVEKRAGKTFTPVFIRENNKPGLNLYKNQLYVYSPPVQKNSSAGKKPAPVRVTDLKDVKPAAHRTPASQPPNQQPQKQQPKGQPPKEQPTQKQHQAQPVKNQPQKQQPKAQPPKEQPAQQQRVEPSKKAEGV